MSDEREGASAPDAYQAKYMGGQALYHDKIRAPLAYHLIFLLPLLVVLGSGFAAAAQAGPKGLVGPAISLVVLPIVWLLFSVLRISERREIGRAHV